MSDQRPDRNGDAGSAETEAQTAIDYAAIRVSMPVGSPITVLRIGAQRTAFATGTDLEPATTLALRIGFRKTADEQFRHDPPTPGEMEEAIQVVEDEIAQARSLIRDGSTLHSTDTAIRDIARVAGLPDQPQMILSIEAMERTFQRLAAVTLGSPLSRERIPAGLDFAATLLILREFMHHLQFGSITVVG